MGFPKKLQEIRLGRKSLQELLLITPPLRSRVAAADMDTFDFLVNLQVFSRRELQGKSYLDRGHLLQCLEIGKQMRAEKKETMVDFQEFLAPFLADLRPDGEPSQREKLHEDHEAQPKKTSQDAWTMATWANWFFDFFPGFTP
jgi:hypothetical protein